MQPLESLPDLRSLLRAPRSYAGLLSRRVRRQLADRSARVPTVLLLTGAYGLVFFLVYWVLLLVQIPAVGDLRETPALEASIAYTADQKELTRYHFENRTWIPLDSIARPVVEALIATEDHRFYRHAGIDVRRIFGAVVGTAAGDRQGGSTITMQLARNVYADIADDFVLTRKMKEWLTALRLESNFSKDEILERYLNSVPFMYDAMGIEAAARTYFQKPAADLKVDEAAVLVGMLKATVYYNPVRNAERAHQRRNVVLAQMVRRGYLDEAAYERMKDRPTPLRFHRLTRQDNHAPFFAEHLRQWLSTWAEAHGYNLYTDGLRIYTTLDLGLQEAAEKAVEEVTTDLQAVVDVEWSSPSPFYSSSLPAYREARRGVTPFAHFWATNGPFLDELLRATPRYASLVQEGIPADSALRQVRADEALVDSVKQHQQRLEAGFIAIEPGTGYVRAWVGGRDFREDEYDHVALARRQPGSTFKPFVYAAALENGFAPYSQLPDVVRSYTDPNTGVSWSPKNFGGASGQMVSLRQGLAFSKNTITAQLITRIGPDKVVQVAHDMGIRSELQAVPSLGLGTSEVTLLEMAAAYTVFATNGVYAAPILVTRIEDRNGRVLATFRPKTRQALPAHTAYAVLDMMRGVINYGTGARLRGLFGARGDLAGKTGTTQRAADGWFMLVHPNLVVGAWAGFNNPMLTFRDEYWGQGAHNALHIVGEFYRAARTTRARALDPAATFKAATGYPWGAGRLTQTDQLNRKEREENKLGDILARIRAQKEARQAEEAPPSEE